MKQILIVLVSLLLLSCREEGNHFKNTIVSQPVYMDIYVLWGQSNMDGSAPNSTLPADWSGPVRLDNTAWVVNFGSGNIEVLECGTNNAKTLGEWGPEMPLAWDYVNSNRDVLIIKVASNGAPLCSEAGRQDWNFYNNTELYWRLVRNTKIALQWCTENGYYPRVKAIISKQGERDATTVACSSDYYGNLKLFYNDYINRFGFEDAQLIDVLNTPNLPQPNYQYLGAVNQAKQQVMGLYPLGQTLSSENWGYKADGVHFNKTGVLQFYQDVKDLL